MPLSAVHDGRAYACMELAGSQKIDTTVVVTVGHTVFQPLTVTECFQAACARRTRRIQGMRRAVQQTAMRIYPSYVYDVAVTAAV